MQMTGNAKACRKKAFQAVKKQIVGMRTAPAIKLSDAVAGYSGCMLPLERASEKRTLIMPRAKKAI